MGSPTDNIHHVKLSAIVLRESPAEILIDAHVRNDSSVPVYLTLPLAHYDANGELIPDWHTAYARVEDDRLHVSQRVWPVPSDLEVYMPEVPYLVELPPTKSYDERIRIALPAKEHYPYAGPTAAPKDAVVTRIMLSIGFATFLDATPKPRPSSLADPSGRQLLRATYADLITRQKILTVLCATSSFAVQLHSENE